LFFYLLASGFNAQVIRAMKTSNCAKTRVDIDSPDIQPASQIFPGRWSFICPATKPDKRVTN
jgi:hypothetical protein